MCLFWLLLGSDAFWWRPQKNEKMLNFGENVAVEQTDYGLKKALAPIRFLPDIFTAGREASLTRKSPRLFCSPSSSSPSPDDTSLCVASSGLLAAEFCRELSAQRLYVLCVLGRLFMQESECFVFCVGCVHVYDACMGCVHCVHCMHCMHFHTKKAWLINVHYLSL